ncbi:transposase [Streptomyces venezuelae]|uniref:transposase n=1 Tax=Streptomyces venezuelae TaxID=54571 RepID=UPI003443697A
MTQNTVARYQKAARPEDLFHGQCQGRASKLDPFKPYLQQQWNEGRTNVWKLYEEIKAVGYPGGYGPVRSYLKPFRKVPGPIGPKPMSPRAVASWILSHPDSLDEVQHHQLKCILGTCPELASLTRHVRSFAIMLARRQGEHLPEWIAAVHGDDLPSLHRFASHLERDLDAAIAGLTLPWNSGVVEGHVNRIKMLKRQMFGRASFALLRRRVLLA